jgi:hypothetical protein
LEDDDDHGNHSCLMAYSLECSLLPIYIHAYIYIYIQVDRGVSPMEVVVSSKGQENGVEEEEEVGVGGEEEQKASSSSSSSAAAAARPVAMMEVDADKTSPTEKVSPMCMYVYLGCCVYVCK